MITGSDTLYRDDRFRILNRQTERKIWTHELEDIKDSNCAIFFGIKRVDLECRMGGFVHSIYKYNIQKENGIIKDGIRGGGGVLK